MPIRGMHPPFWREIAMVEAQHNKSRFSARFSLDRERIGGDYSHTERVPLLGEPFRVQHAERSGMYRAQVPGRSPGSPEGIIEYGHACATGVI